MRGRGERWKLDELIDFEVALGAWDGVSRPEDAVPRGERLAVFKDWLHQTVESNPGAVWLGGLSWGARILGVNALERIRRSRSWCGGSSWIKGKRGIPDSSPAPPGPLLLAGLVVFIAAHAFGQGAVIWVFISEIFPNRVRAQGAALGSAVHWIMAAAISWTFPLIASRSGGHTFTVYALCMVGQLIWVWRAMPETKGVPLEAMEREVLRP